MERKELIENSQVTGSGRTEENGESKDSEGSVASGQETDTLDREDQGYPWQKVERKKQKKKPIIIVGDSMIKEMRANISMKEKGSELCSYRGLRSTDWSDNGESEGEMQRYR